MVQLGCQYIAGLPPLVCHLYPFNILVGHLYTWMDKDNVDKWEPSHQIVDLCLYQWVVILRNLYAAR